ncbi:DUF4974 domain-containing protein [Pseudoflavitalea sp. G-6-1-2]|uniref:FecR family protein n=1 Tax=Pseudoflavitalea sp. G-6-1-2 TaxID=2728841 RepID=UPI00146EEF5E|nr:FecR family protein [Pseudoflavitalea sp. G-6-1-2]NML22885.1 DUF4974 domain-containing protein [Pseudoflavitalea sp. G-6-1-2]
MESKISRFVYLFDLYSNGTCTTAERKEYLELVLDPAVQPVLDQLIRNSVEQHNAELPIDEPRSKEMLQNILTLNPELNTYDLPLPARSGTVKRIAYSAVAAAVLFAVGIGIWRWLRTSHPADNQIVNNEPVIPPGREGALLTLSDGRTVVLDSLGNGWANQQEGSTVTLKDRQLVYQQSDNGDGQVHYNTMQTPRGRRFHVKLPDGTLVWLNAASMIRYPTSFTGKTREVELNGEAYFDVAKNTAAPFVVKKKETTVTVLGTAFNVNAYEDEPDMKVTLVKGSVKVADATDASTLQPGQQAVIDKSIRIIPHADIEAVTAWKDGLFIMRSVTLSALMRQISRWYDVEVVVEGNLPQKQFGGILGMDLPLSDMIRTLQSYGLSVKLENRKLTIQP